MLIIKLLTQLMNYEGEYIYMELTNIGGKFEVYEICDISTGNVFEYEVVIVSNGDSSRCLISKENDPQLYAKLRDVFASIAVETAKSVKSLMVKENPELSEESIDNFIEEVMKSAK